MQFYSGFSLQNEEHFFDAYLERSEYTIAGFSYGALFAMNAVLDSLERGRRIDRLQLFSPLFFQTKDAKFKRLQLMSYKKNRTAYLKQFISGCFSPYEVQKLEHRETEYEELQELLEYEWSLESLQRIEHSGVEIEVYLGGADAIIDVVGAREFFLQVATVTYIKEANHFLQLLSL